MHLSLSGTWAYGDSRGYGGTCSVPGVVLDPARAQPLWLRRQVTLPQQPFTRLLLILKGARFCPQVFINGDLVSQAEGGMCYTRHLFAHPDCIPGAQVTLEIRLCSLDDVPLTDASRIPEADHWRSNLSSCLWDDVLLYPVGNAAVSRIVPAADESSVTAHVDVDAVFPCPLTASITDADGHCLYQEPFTAHSQQTTLRLPVKLRPWSPESPVVYTLTVTADDGRIASAMSVPCGLSRFRVDGLGFRLNDQPLRLRGTSVVWHRFCRDPEGRTLAFDTAWFEKNIVLRLKRSGANLLRFHLGAPMEALLDLCDRHGLCVQLEWLFFHGMKADETSLVRQWRELLTLAACHPCVCILQLWNETEGPELATAYRALSVLDQEFPHTVISHRDVVHVHKYWWSLFENLNLSYDSASELPGAAMVDEFGGNYLDGDLQTGGYPEAADAFARFLGHHHSAAQRSELQALANARVGEYWRRLGVAGIATFCALSSPEDGNHHFLGPLKDGVPKRVWQACSALYAPRSVSLEMWDRAFEPSQPVSCRVWLFNDTSEDAVLHWQTAVVDESGHAACSPVYEHAVAAHTHRIVETTLTLPARGHCAQLQARLLDHPQAVSSWPVRLHRFQPDASLVGKTFAMLQDEPELRDFALGLGMVETSDTPQLLLGSHDALVRMDADASWRSQIQRCIAGGTGMLLTQLGPPLLGEGYVDDRSQIRLDGDTKLDHAQSWLYHLPYERLLRFDAQAEAESCCHPPLGQAHFPGLQPGALQLGNGYRGGLVAPAVTMELEPQDHAGLMAQWIRRGAPEDVLQSPDCVAYQLEGFYAFATQPSQETADALRSRVRFLVSDAPSLEKRINPEARMEVIPLGRMLAQASQEQTPQPEALAVCGRGLEHIAACAFQPEGTSGVIVLSQLLSRGRLVSAYREAGLYGARFDPEMAQLVQSLILRALPA